MRILDAVVGRLPAYRNLLAEWKKSLEWSKKLEAQLDSETRMNFDLLEKHGDFTREITKLREQLKAYIPKDVHLQVVETAERLKFLNETAEALIRTLEQKIYDLEHPVTVTTTASWEPEDDGCGENPPKKSRKKVAKKAKPLRILRGRRAKK